MSMTEKYLDTLAQERFCLLIDPSLSMRMGERGLQSISLLQSAGFETFSYFTSWRTSDVKGNPVEREPGGYDYISLANRARVRKNELPDSIACFSTQWAEDNSFSVAFLVKEHLRNSLPRRMCLVADTEDFALRTSLGRLLRDEEYVRTYRVVQHSSVMKEARRAVNEFLKIKLEFCTAWAQLGWAVGLATITESKPETLKELLDEILHAPYLAIWDDMSRLTPYGDERQDRLRLPVADPVGSITRHYGLSRKTAEDFWAKVSTGHDDFLNPYLRERLVKKEFSSTISKSALRIGEETSVVAKLLRSSIASQDSSKGTGS